MQQCAVGFDLAAGRPGIGPGQIPRGGRYEALLYQLLGPLIIKRGAALGRDGALQLAFCLSHRSPGLARIDPEQQLSGAHIIALFEGNRHDLTIAARPHGHALAGSDGAERQQGGRKIFHGGDLGRHKLRRPLAAAGFAAGSIALAAGTGGKQHCKCKRAATAEEGGINDHRFAVQILTRCPGVSPARI